MQGYDSVAMDIDVEVGGRDQLFNMMMGRDLMHKMKRKNKFVMTTKLLVDAQGNKVGKTTGNAISFTDSADKILGAIMSFPDDVIIKGLEYLTSIKISEVQKIEKAIADGANPLEFKKLLAFEVTKQIHGEQSAKKAQQEFESVHQKGDAPKDLNINVEENIAIIDAVSVLVSSKSQAKRLIDQGAIEVDGKTIKDGKLKTKRGQVLKVGKKTYAKVGK